jgi:predicted RNA-binding protein
MCELKVIVEKEVAFENVIYAKSIENRVVVKDVLGKSMEFKNHTITEVDVNNERLVLSPMNAQS